jgi:LmbE family N-acetylglucosaminyl deacetylase
MGNATRFAARPLSGGGTSALAWDTWGRRFPELDLTDCKSLFLVAPHPDDETLGFGAAAATLQSRGVTVQVVSVTDGDASYPGLPDRERRELARIRRTELHGATGVLGLPPPISLGLPDGMISTYLCELADVLTTLLAKTPGAWCAATWRGDGHPDHEAVGAAAAVATDRTGERLIEFPLWMWHWANPNDDAVPWERASRISPNRVGLERKWRAAELFRTQLEPHRSRQAVLPSFVLDRLRSVGEVVFT